MDHSLPSLISYSHSHIQAEKPGYMTISVSLDRLTRYSTDPQDILTRIQRPKHLIKENQNDERLLTLSDQQDTISPQKRHNWPLIRLHRLLLLTALLDSSSRGRILLRNLIPNLRCWSRARLGWTARARGTRRGATLLLLARHGDNDQ